MDPLTKGKTAREAQTGLLEGTFEEQHGRRGFKGRSAHLYHAHPPTGWVRFEGNLRPHRFDLNKLEPTDRLDPRGWPVAFMSNADLRLSVSRRSAPMPFYARNADWDELFFVHRGTGVVETDYGPLQFEPGDYLVLPCSTTYRIVPDTLDNFFLVIESKGEFEPPESGPPGRQALYDAAAVVTPEPDPHLVEEDGWEWEVRILADGAFSSVFYPWDPLDVVGWKGDLTAWKINLRDLRPAASPGAQSTFITPGAVVRTFLQRPLKKDAKTQDVPYFHRNTDYDEFVFCHCGDLFPKDDLQPGMAALHPRGIPHGPHAQAVSNQHNRDRTEEYAVLLDARQPLQILESGALVEDPDSGGSRSPE
jgi:homogentisate 1,2-dioxygenase